MVEALRGVSTIDLLKPNIESTFSPGRLFRVPVTMTSSISGSCADAVSGSPVRQHRSGTVTHLVQDEAFTVSGSSTLAENIFYIRGSLLISVGDCLCVLDAGKYD